MQTLVIGGSRGIGWELAKLYAAAGDMVIVTGRKAPDEPSATIAFRELDLSPADWSTKLSALLKDTGQVDRLVYAPGYYQEGTVTDLSKAEILDMIQVCGIGFTRLCHACHVKLTSRLAQSRAYRVPEHL